MKMKPKYKDILKNAERLMKQSKFKETVDYLTIILIDEADYKYATLNLLSSRSMGFVQSLNNASHKARYCENSKTNPSELQKGMKDFEEHIEECKRFLDSINVIMSEVDKRMK